MILIRAQQNKRVDMDKRKMYKISEVSKKIEKYLKSLLGKHQKFLR